MTEITVGASQTFPEEEGYKRTGTSSREELQSYATYFTEKVWRNLDAFEILTVQGLTYGMVIPMGTRADGTPYLILCKSGLMEEEVDDDFYDKEADEPFGVDPIFGDDEDGLFGDDD